MAGGQLPVQRLLHRWGLLGVIAPISIREWKLAGQDLWGPPQSLPEVCALVSLATDCQPVNPQTSGHGPRFGLAVLSFMGWTPQPSLLGFPVSSKPYQWQMDQERWDIFSLRQGLATLFHKGPAGKLGHLDFSGTRPNWGYHVDSSINVTEEKIPAPSYPHFAWDGPQLMPIAHKYF